ncbi:hypothetical protein Pan44_31900 [Caulifigura coniformis]|uniref:Uncharacterized protein n=1 Tax=Caulifigura coniformis TaxID=2527983 RepID=A0A517SGA2_9PLAN|nr:hypothetical protein Pan44_31900 [Caulifigura coniformis]
MEDFNGSQPPAPPEISLGRESPPVPTGELAQAAQRQGAPTTRITVLAALEFDARQTALVAFSGSTYHDLARRNC